MTIAMVGAIAAAGLVGAVPVAAATNVFTITDPAGGTAVVSNGVTAAPDPAKAPNGYVFQQAFGTLRACTSPRLSGMRSNRPRRSNWLPSKRTRMASRLCGDAARRPPER